MYTGTKRSMGFLGWTAGLVVTLAVAAGGAVAVPQLINSDSTPPAASSQIDAAAAPTAPVAEVAVAAEAPAPEAVPEVTAPEVEVEVTIPPTTTVKAAPATTVPAPVVTLPPVTLPPVTVPALAPRTVPSAAQVQSAIAGISGLVQLPFFITISPANVAQVGDQVCTAFDQGQTFAQVKATGLSMVSAYVTVTPTAADYAVRTAVSMYCPAYASKLV